MKLKTLITTITLITAPICLKAYAVNELMVVMEIDKQMNGGFEAMLPAVDQLALQLSLNEEEKKELLDIYRAWFEEDIDRKKLVDGTADLYRQAFSEDEIKEMLQFFSTPTGKKVVKESPALMQKGAQLGMVEAQEKQALLLERLSPFIEKHTQQQE